MRNRRSRFPSAVEVSARPQEERRNLEGAFDTDLYGAAGNRFDGYVTSIPASGDEADLSAASPITLAPRLASYTGYDAAVADDEDHTTNRESRRIIDREDEYRGRRLRRYLSPDRHDAFAAGEATPAPSVRTYADAMRENRLQHRKEELLREIAKIKEEQKQPVQVKRRDRWDVTAAGANNTSSAWDDDGAPDAATPKKQRMQRSRWEDDATPPMMQRSRWDDDATPPIMQRSRWDDDKTPPKKQRSRWDDEAPAASAETPLGAEYLATPTASQVAAWGRPTPEWYQPLSWERHLEERNRPLTDDELDAMFPQKGYKILQPPASYQPIRTPARRLLAATPTPLCTPVFAVPEVELRFVGRCS